MSKLIPLLDRVRITHAGSTSDQASSGYSSYGVYCLGGKSLQRCEKEGDVERDVEKPFRESIHNIDLIAETLYVRFGATTANCRICSLSRF